MARDATKSGSTKDVAQGAAKAAKSTAKAAAKTVADNVRDEARDLARDVKSEAKGRVSGIRDATAGEVNNIATALRKAAGEAREGSPQERTFGMVANTLADVSETVGSKDLGEIADDVAQFAKRNPLAFVAGAALAGFALSRVAKARDLDGPNISSEDA